jgi:hypothetical protein
VIKENFFIWLGLFGLASLVGACGDGQVSSVQVDRTNDQAPDYGDFNPEAPIEEGVPDVAEIVSPVAPDGPTGGEGEGGAGGIGGAPLPPAHTNDMGQLIRDNVAGGIVYVPNGTYFLSDVTDFTPTKPLVIVAETEGGVVVTPRDGAQEGETALYLNRSHNIAFVGVHFVDATLRIRDSSGIHLWYTFHTYPPQKKPRPTHKTCGNGRSPDGVLMTNSRDVKFHGVEFDNIGNDAIKINSIRDAQLVGARLTNVDHQNYQTDTTDAEAASCGHKAGDKYYHSDALQIYPGDVHNFVVSDSYTERNMMLQVEQVGQSVSGFKIQHSWLSNPRRDCVTINTRVKSKAGDATMELTIVDSTSWCEPKPEKWHFYTGGTTNGHNLMVGNVTYETSKKPTAQTPADDWRRAYPYEAWGCFVRKDIGWIEVPAACSHDGFPSFRGPSNTKTTKVVHRY